MNKILIVSTTGMGDSLWATPAIRALKLSFPEVQIDLLVDARWKSLFHENPHIYRILDYRKPWVYQLGIKLGFLLTPYDHILVFHANRGIRRMLHWIHGSVLAHQRFPWLEESQIVAIDGAVHGIQRRLTLIEKLGVKPAGGHMELFFNKRDQGICADYMARNKISPKEFIYVNVGASLPHRRWRRFDELTRKILETTSYKVVLGGGPHEAPLIESIKASLNSARISHSYDCPIRDDAFLISQARMMVTCDTGPMHIAFALKIPTVALFGATDPRQSGPFELDDNLCFPILSNLYSQPEGSKDNPDYFDQISLPMVWEKVQAALGSSGA